ncbi:hypothetical protein NLJ89_g8558 [Agrocybe chaxingu]|uniref:Mediator of RNA polymerase II transcription subunit 5 n=1 Tax=Agrocybe chaxingu TaxID=84603 RepID=A0A9W8MSM9_9AGAR|nr:hypothetical protein NLJ89_g8558 [Agrocybe chaxingu]
MAKSVGFVPTDPDTISSHEKKRHYLECLEHYILYLHQQFELLGVTPPALELVSSYRGLSSQSIRTLLVHMEHNTRRLNARTLEEEQRLQPSLLPARAPGLVINVIGGVDPALVPGWNFGHQDEVAASLSNSVLLLYRSYPGDPGLQEYIRAAIQDNLLPVPIFVSTLLQAARSSELHIPATLDTLVRLALEAHYATGRPPLGSIVSVHDPPTTTLRTIEDGFALLRTAYSLPISHFHQLTESVAELLVMLLSCVPDISSVPTSQALVAFGEVNETLAACQVPPEVRQVLDSFAVTLQLLIGDDAKLAKEAQMMHTMQFSLGKGDMLGASSETDVITLGMLLNHLVTYRAHEWGAGELKNAVALLVAGFRWSNWTPSVFYTQLLLSAFTCLAQSDNAKLWKAFIVGRLPTLLASFADAINADNSSKSDLRGGLHAGLTAVFHRPDVIVQVDHALTRDATPETLEEDASRSFSREFLQQLLKQGLVTPALAAQLDPQASNDGPPKWHAEAHDMGLELSAYLETKLMQDQDISDAQVWVERIWKDPGSHAVFANVMLKRFSSLTISSDVESLGHACKILHTSDHALDMVALHVGMHDIIFSCLQFVEDFDCETVADPQTAISHLGDVVLFLQYTLFDSVALSKNGRKVSTHILNTDVTIRSHERPQEDMVAFGSWFKALFDTNSEGIEDGILRATKPKVLLRIALSLIAQAISMVALHKLEKDVLMNGISYFTGPLLNWTLVGVVKSLARDVLYKPIPPAVQLALHYEIIQSLILSPSCPKPVLALCSPQLIALVSERKRQQPQIPSSFNVSAIRQAVADSIGLKGGADALPVQPTTGQIWYQQVQQAIQTAFTAARSHKTPFLDVKRCLKFLPPINSSSYCGRNFKIQRFTHCCPIFLHVVLPSVIAPIERQQPPDQTSIELVVAIVSSTLNAALHLEWAMRSVSGDDGLVLGQSSTSMARRLALDLRSNRASQVYRTILQQLASSQALVANFPVFKSELVT